MAEEEVKQEVTEEEVKQEVVEGQSKAEEEEIKSPSLEDKELVFNYQEIYRRHVVGNAE